MHKTNLQPNALNFELKRKRKIELKEERRRPMGLHTHSRGDLAMGLGLAGHRDPQLGHVGCGSADPRVSFP